MTTEKQRSPAYPATDLETAITPARKMWDASRDTTIDRQTVATLIGYSPGSGTAFRTDREQFPWRHHG